MFYEGRQIGSYTLLRKLGKGGFGEVWLAEKRSQFVTKKVAVKLPLDEQVNFDAIRQEAELWEQASGHPNVLPIIDADVFDGQVVIVSEYASGGSLADRLKSEGKLALQKAVEITIGILNGLEFLHSRKIIHRDIKPQNILLQGDTPRLADFGISRAMNTTIVSSTIIGTDAYMSPESFDGKRNVQTDIWSVGVVLYALLADKLPFPQEHPSERMFAILTKEFAPLPADVPQNLQGIVAKALAKQPENRYHTTSEMRDELQKALLGIAHPTFAPTEVFQIPIENLPTIPTLENRYETNESEKETVVSPQNFNFPAPTEPSFQQESIVTNIKEASPVTPVFSPLQEAQKPQAAQFQMVDNRMPDNSQTSYDSLADVIRKNDGFKYALFGAGALFLLLGVTYILSKFNYSPTVSNRAAVSNSSAISNRAPLSNSSNNSALNAVSTNSASNAISTEKMDIVLKAVGEKVAFTADVDKELRVFTLEPGGLKNFFPKESLRLRYYKDVADNVQLIINGKVIAVPTVPADPTLNSIVIKITKDNLAQILQSGKITAIE